MTTVTATCEASSGPNWDRERPSMPPYCRQTIGLRSWLDARGVTRVACSITGHRGNVERRFGIWDEPEQADPITAAKARDDLADGVAHFEWHGHDIEVEVVD